MERKNWNNWVHNRMVLANYHMWTLTNDVRRAYIMGMVDQMFSDGKISKNELEILAIEIYNYQFE